MRRSRGRVSRRISWGKAWSERGRNGTKHSRGHSKRKRKR